MSSALANPLQNAMEPYGFAGNLSQAPFSEVDFNDGKYWSMPSGQSQEVYAKHTMGLRYVKYTWAPKGEGSASPLTDYVIDFKEMTQQNQETKNIRRIRVVWVDTFLAKNASARNLHASAVQPGMAPTCDGSWLQERPMPIVEAAVRNDMWWAMPENLSAMIYKEYLMGCQGVSFVWSWSNGRKCIWTNNGEDTNLNRYVIDFNQMVQKYTDSGGHRTIRIFGQHLLIRAAQPDV